MALLGSFPSLTTSGKKPLFCVGLLSGSLPHASLVSDAAALPSIQALPAFYLVLLHSPAMGDSEPGSRAARISVGGRPSE